MTATDAQPVITYRRAEVRAVRRPTPRTLRITLGGPDVEGLPVVAPDGYMKLFFPLPGQDDPELPPPPPDGDVGAWYKSYLAMPEAVRPPMRTYTLRARRETPSGVELDVDFVLHEHGPGRDWARSAELGTRLAFTGPYGLYDPRPEHDWILLVGDETAVPAMSAIVEARPDADSRPVVSLAEVHDAAEHQDWSAHTGVAATWLSTPTSAPSRLPDVLRHLSGRLPAGRPYVWLSGEAAVVRTLRRHVVGPLGVPRGDVCFTGYWRCGRTEEQRAADTIAAVARGEDPTGL